MLLADINGNKKPNKLGRDMFIFIINGNNIGYSYFNGYIRKAGLHFINVGNTAGNASNVRTHAMSSTNSYGCNGGYFAPGGNCGFIIQMDGWQIKDDYPW